MAEAVPIEFDARDEAAAHSTAVLLPLRKTLLGVSIVMLVFGGVILGLELYHLAVVGAPSSNQASPVVFTLVAATALVFAAIYLLIQCPALRRPLPTSYRLDPGGFTARWEDETDARLSWNDPKVRLVMRDMRDLADVEGCATLISRTGSFVPFAVPSKMYDQVLSEAKALGLVTKARYYRSRGGLKVHLATIQGKRTD